MFWTVFCFCIFRWFSCNTLARIFVVVVVLSFLWELFSVWHRNKTESKYAHASRSWCHPLSLPVSVVPVCAWTDSHVTSSWLITLCQSMSPVNNLKYLLKSIWKHFWRRFKNPKVTLRIDKNLCSYRLFIEMILIFLKASTWVIKNSHESFK